MIDQFERIDVVFDGGTNNEKKKKKKKREGGRQKRTRENVGESISIIQAERTFEIPRSRKPARQMVYEEAGREQKDLPSGTSFSRGD